MVNKAQTSYKELVSSMSRGFSVHTYYLNPDIAKDLTDKEILDICDGGSWNFGYHRQGNYSMQIYID